MSHSQVHLAFRLQWLRAASPGGGFLVNLFRRLPLLGLLSYLFFRPAHHSPRGLPASEPVGVGMSVAVGMSVSLDEHQESEKKGYKLHV